MIKPTKEELMQFAKEQRLIGQDDQWDCSLPLAFSNELHQVVAESGDAELRLLDESHFVWLNEDAQEDGGRKACRHRPYPLSAEANKLLAYMQVEGWPTAIRTPLEGYTRNFLFRMEERLATLASQLQEKRSDIAEMLCSIMSDKDPVGEPGHRYQRAPLPRPENLPYPSFVLYDSETTYFEIENRNKKMTHRLEGEYFDE